LNAGMINLKSASDVEQYPTVGEDRVYREQRTITFVGHTSWRRNSAVFACFGPEHCDEIASCIRATSGSLR
jgi:hypothetical protein